MATLCPKCRGRFSDTEVTCPTDGRVLVRDMAGVVLHDRYTLRDLIGLGGMGSTVWRAVQSNVGRSVAIKLLPPTNEAAGQRFEREARIASSLNHPHIVTVHDFGQAMDGSLFLVMEFLEGRTLHRELRDNAALPLDRALRIADQTLRALEHAHAANVVHRDLKPGNLFLTKKGEDTNFLKVLDFGLAKYVADSVEGTADEAGVTDHDVTGQAHVVCGTPNFMAPEQVLCGRVDGRADIYAMGVVLFRMLTGHTPFGSDSNYDLYRQVISQPPPTFAEVAPGHEIPVRLEEIVRKAMAKSADDRYLTARQMRLALREVRHSLGVLSDDSDDFYSASSVVRLRSSVVAETAKEISNSAVIPVLTGTKDRRFIVGVAAIVLVLVAVAVVWYFGVDRTPLSGSTSVAEVTSLPEVGGATGAVTVEEKVGGEPEGRVDGIEPPSGVVVAEAPVVEPPVVHEEEAVVKTEPDVVENGQPVAGVESANENVAQPTPKNATLEVTSEPAGAEIVENGNVLGTTPYRFESPVGLRELVVRRSGFQDYPLRLQVGAATADDDVVLHHVALVQAKVESKRPGRGKIEPVLGQITERPGKITSKATPQPLVGESAGGSVVTNPVPTAGVTRIKVTTLDDGVTREAVVPQKNIQATPVASKTEKPLQVQVLGAENPGVTKESGTTQKPKENNSTPAETRAPIRVETLGQ